MHLVTVDAEGRDGGCGGLESIPERGGAGIVRSGSGMNEEPIAQDQRLVAPDGVTGAGGREGRLAPR